MTEVNWIEIPVLQLERAVKFYTNVLYSKVQLGEIDGETHGILKMEGQVGGILYKTDEIKQGIKVYFHVDRLLETLEKVPIFGGEIIQGKTLLKSYNTGNQSVVTGTMFDGKIGYFAKIKDSEGNILGLHSNA